MEKYETETDLRASYIRKYLGAGGGWMESLLKMIEEAAPFACAFGVVGGLIAWITLSLIRRRFAPLPLILISALYAGFLLHGTIVSRVDRLRDFLEWELPDFDTVWWQFELGARTIVTAQHAVANIALFVPWGFLGMCYQRKIGAGFLVLLSGMLMSVLIEFFQVCHGLVFDLGDVLTNSIGTATGCVIGLPVLLINGWVYNRRRRRKKRNP